MTDTRRLREAAPFVNSPVRHPNGFMERLRCEVRVYGNERMDIGGHQCGNPAKWRIPDFDKWGDILVCGRHADGRSRRSTHLHSIFGYVAGTPTSVRWNGKGSRAALDRLDSHEKADPLHREAGRGIGRDGDTEVETIRWDDGSYTVADVRRSDSHEKADGPPR